ncbi:MAG: flagellar filament capping protein FliD [Phycisphaeraceae bacterium]|nr:flagellar filament capping protein FliD [Phycisphaeraceae bacterium]
MSGISSGVGPFSGINTAQLIERLIAIESRPVSIAQGRLGQLQLQQTAILDLNSRLSALRDAASAFRTKKTFNLTSAASSNESALRGTASTSALPGTYQFLVDRLVSSQQLLSRGFADRDATGIGAGSFTFESARARLDRDVSLSDLNGGEGVARGKIVLSEGSNSVTVDLSKAATVSEVLDAINSNGVVAVTAKADGGRLQLRHASGSSFTVSDGAGYTTASSLGIAGASNGSGVLTGSSVYGMSLATSLASLNDGNGVSLTSIAGTGAYNLVVRVTLTGGHTTDVKVNLGEVYETQGNTQVLKETAVSTVGGAIARINAALEDAGKDFLKAAVAADGSRLTFADTSGTVTDLQFADNPTLKDTTARDLGLTSGSFGGGVYHGATILAGLNTTLASTLHGGKGIGGDGVLEITARDGTSFSVTIDTGGSISKIAREIEDASGLGSNGKPRLTVAVNSKGTGLVVTDNTGATSSNLIIRGTDGVNTAESLGLQTAPGGVASSTVESGNLQRAYVARSTLVGTLNGGKGIGVGKIRLTDGFGLTVVVDIGKDTTNVGQLIDEINSMASGKGLKLKAVINDTGDGIAVVEDLGSGPAGTQKIKIADETGSVAASLRLAGEAKGVGAENTLVGSYERVLTFSPGDTLEAVAKKINEAGVGLSASIIRDGSGSSPFRLALSATSAGVAGRVLVDTGNLDLALNVLDKGNDSRVFFGSTDPARAILLGGSSNTLDGVISGVTIDLRSPSADPVTLTVTRDTSGIEAEVNRFIDAFNGIVTRIKQQQSYNSETRAKGPLLGDGSTSALHVALFNTLQSPAQNIAGRYRRLAEVGVEVGSGGKVALNVEKFRRALAEDPASVEALFTARVQESSSGQVDLGDGITATDPDAGTKFSSLGVVGMIEELARRYTDTSKGLWTAKRDATDSMIRSQSRRIDSMNARLDARRAALQSQFQRMEKAIAQLQQQQSALNSLG